MADSEDWKREEEEEEEEADEIDYRTQKDAVLFVIDVSESMLTSPPVSDSKKADTDSPTLAALKCAYMIMQQRIISSPKDMMGIMLYGIKETNFKDQSGLDTSVYPHCYLLTDLDIPSAEDVKALKEIVEDEEEAKNILVPTEENVDMNNVLFCANQIFTTRAPNFGSRRLFIITDRDDPHSGDKSQRSLAAVRAKDLYDIGVVVELFPISIPEYEFDRSKFYDDIIYRDPLAEDAPNIGPNSIKSNGDGLSLLNNLIMDVNSKQSAKRSLFSNLPFEIAPNLTISVNGYNVLHKQVPARSAYVWMEGEVPQIPIGETTQMAEDTARIIQKVEIKKAYKFGGSQVLFTPDEQKQLKHFGPPGLRIIGFKPQSMLPYWASIKKSTFVYPSENDYVGSTRVFSALWDKLLEDKKMGLAWHIARKNANPTIVAILPSVEKLDPSTNQQIFPAGLWLYPLPFADDLRSVAAPAPIIAPDKLIDNMRVIVQQLQLPKAQYDPRNYPNPSLQWHYRILQAMALEEEIPEVPEDKTVPKYRQIDKRAGTYISNWALTLASEYGTWSLSNKSSGMKRDRSEDNEEEKQPRKRNVLVRNSAKKLGEMDKEELKNLVLNGGLEKFKVEELKEWLLGKGLYGVGRKAKLIERVEEWVDQN
ncbi:BcKU70, protein involved in DNA reparation [Sclerotinia borealis F-4128]|uniref:ATP-dependent DNA helicase II subunit 1 n=1 Tax=Sclerotinia borealis (strain F-4128) TaxID=1432307 RepID=W9CXZ7_SCLBF|nr:BcKU70, protein involved in DNA reparation [Sclerotinia borealis F-4128]